MSGVFALAKVNQNEFDLIDNVVAINRVSKVVKGGRRFSFSALVVVGDGNGSVGAAMGKANEVPDAIRKGNERTTCAVRVPVINGTHPHEIVGHHGAGRVLLRPASQGTGVIAGGPVRAVLEAAGIKNVLTKSLGTSNPNNVVNATIDALQSLVSPQEMAARRGKSVDEIGHNPS